MPDDEVVRVVSYSTGIPPLHRVTVKLKVSYLGPFSLRQFSGSFEHFSLIQMVKCSLLEKRKTFFKLSTMCRSNLFRNSNFDANVKLFEMFIIFCVVTARTEKVLFPDLLGIIR